MINKKVVVITGATSGIGYETAKRFASENYIVLTINRDAIKGERLCDELKHNGAEAQAFICDLSNVDELSKVAKDIANIYGRVDILFNNAGIMLPSVELDRLETAEWKQTFNVNVESVYHIVGLLYEYIAKVKGCIINNASIAGMHSYVAGRSYAYSASKAALIQLSRQMALNYAPEGVRVNCICPGIIDTKILGDRNREEYAKRVPMGRLGRAEEVAELVSFLGSEHAKYITGAVIPIDGGVSL